MNSLNLISTLCILHCMVILSTVFILLFLIALSSVLEWLWFMMHWLLFCDCSFEIVILFNPPPQDNEINYQRQRELLVSSRADEIRKSIKLAAEFPIKRCPQNGKFPSLASLS